jgi:hypothetical protein
MNSPIPQRKFDYRGSVISIELTGNGDQSSARADVHRDGEFTGRVALTASRDERDALFEKLDSRAKELVDELLAGAQPATVGGAIARSR